MSWAGLNKFSPRECKNSQMNRNNDYFTSITPFSAKVVGKHTPPKTISEMNKDELVDLFKEACNELLQKSQVIDIDDVLKHIKYDLVWQTECNQDKDNRTFTIKVKPEIKNIRWEE